jgi:hypothetical protein
MMTGKLEYHRCKSNTTIENIRKVEELFRVRFPKNILNLYYNVMQEYIAKYCLYR